MKSVRIYKLCALVVITLLVSLAFSTATSSASTTSSATISSSGTVEYAPIENLALIPDHWYIPTGGMAPAALDYNNLHNGHVSIRMYKDPANPDLSREVNCNSWEWDTDVEAGDHVVFTVWMKIQPSTYGSTQGGIRCGIDYYKPSIPHSYTGTFEYVTGTADPYGNIRDPSGAYPATNELNYVHWGSGWTQITMDFIVPDQITADGGFGNPLGQVFYAPFHLTPWIQIWSDEDGNPVGETAVGWFADAEFYIY